MSLHTITGTLVKTATKAAQHLKQLSGIAIFVAATFLLDTWMKPALDWVLANCGNFQPMVIASAVVIVLLRGKSA